MNDTSPNAIAALAAPFDAPLPCGENLEYDAQFLALEEALRGKPEVQYGNTITPAAAPDWKAVQGLALALMERTRDLRVAVSLARALLALEGAPGLAAGLALLAALLSGQWAHVHPQLDPDDDADPTLRLNTLAVLVAADGMLRQVRDMPLIEARAVGVVSLRDVESASDTEAAGSATMSRSTIAAMLDAAPSDQVGAAHAALHAALASVSDIEVTLGAHLAPGIDIDFAPLTTLLQVALVQLLPHLAAAGGAAQAGNTPGGDAAAPGQRGDGDIASRADVVRQLERLCGWYALHEPSSPVPLLLARARGLVDKNFAELMLELAPDGLGQLAQVSGVRHES